MLFIMRGTSCSGKDRFIDKNFERYAVLSSDWYRQVLTNDISNQRENGLVFDTIRQLLEIRLKNRVPYTVINATNLKLKSIKEFLELAYNYGEKVTVISIDPPEEGLLELMARSKHRSEKEGGLFVPEEVLEKHLKTYQDSLLTFEDRAMRGEFLFVRIDQNYDIVDRKGWT